MSRLIETLQPGMRVFVPTLSTESSLLLDELRADPDRARGVVFTGVQFPGIDRADYLALHPEARQAAFFMTRSVRAGLDNGRADLLSLDYLGIARHLRQAASMDLAVAHLTLPDVDGWCSPGLSSDFMPLVWSHARRRVAHLNPRMPRTQGSFRVHISELDAAVEADAPLNEFIESPSGGVETQIGRHVAELVRNGDTLQFGIGSVPLALAGALSGHRGLRFHGGLVSSALQTLWEAGAMDPDAPIKTGVVLGNASFHDFVARLDPLRLADVTKTHDPAILATIPRFMAINAAAEVDLFGQINGERVGGMIQAGSGGLPAFAQGALASPGGRLLICLGATARKGTVSRIVPVLGDQSLCTVPRYQADAVVTEHGVAELRGLSLDARAEALIGIAAPEHRTALQEAWSSIRRAA
ncbi:acetyl-CoA hydrolase/transferase C-terminal domain-containing protein [Variovorax sp. J22P168]|uniref:acetyl-CoA hydrolase/transferase family protein n=1 Tax=Variovorax jilinensis TaxID=3053513 RepID=UPI0025788B76|nr:acetyl-CoA hydrolase/transferase C-terminal domain-containing protein [Variovorax sp. J22P168]MDM0015130.1 acetyl-CoA hydrolase/transferase C-terminal domain-containing protein [Variovorax sp. J22P168]